jgi:hypothetical protein
MALTLGLTGMDPATEAALKAAFAEANARLHGHWQLVPEAGADHIVVDMDSMYGPMSWLRLHAAGKHVIGLTSAPRTQTDFRLGRPFDTFQVERLLSDIAGQEGVALADSKDSAPGSGRVEDVASAESTAVVADAVSGTAPTLPTPDEQEDEAVGLPEPLATASGGPRTAAPPSGLTPAPAPQDQLPKEDIGQTEAVAAPASESMAATSLPPARDPVFADWLLPGALSRRVRYRRASGPTLLIDPGAQTWHGPTPLKPIAAYFEGKVEAGDFETVDDADWATESVAAGTAQPLSRLHWLGGLLAGGGALLPGLDPEGRYVLTKWPQTEREYPKHFRIATAMMKGPATVAELAAASDMPAGEVADFINANLATGYAEFVPEPTPEAEEPAKPTGLFGRLRNR